MASGAGLTKAVKKCWACGDLVYRYTAKFCLRCAKFGRRMRVKRFTREAVDAIWDYVRRYGYVCYYTKLKLDLEDRRSNRYLVFDHLIPRDPRRVVITANVINEMKSDMSEDEFKDTVCQLADHFRKATPVNLKPFVYWYRLHPSNEGN